jgi:hypothetical protein
MFRYVEKLLADNNRPIGDVVYPRLLRPRIDKDDNRFSNSQMVFHFAIWTLVNNVTEFKLALDFGAPSGPMVEITGMPLWVLFEKQTDLNAFQDWVSSYSKWFIEGDIAERFFPELPTTGHYDLYFATAPVSKRNSIALGISEHERQKEAVDFWVWILTNCKKPVFLTDTGVAFTDPDDAVLYRLSRDQIVTNKH